MADLDHLEIVDVLDGLAVGQADAGVDLVAVDVLLRDRLERNDGQVGVAGVKLEQRITDRTSMFSLILVGVCGSR